MRRFVLGVAIACLFAAPNMVSAGDNEIATHIEQKLREANQDGRLKNFGLDMHVSDGVVWFKGYVATPEQEKLVLTTAQQAKNLGVVKIVDEITVKTVATPAPAPVSQEAVAAAAPANAPVQQATTGANQSSQVQQVATQQDEAMIPVPPIPADALVPPSVSRTNALQVQRTNVAQAPMVIPVSQPRPSAPQQQMRTQRYQMPLAMAPTGNMAANAMPMPARQPQGGMGMGAPAYTPVSARSANSQYDQPTMPNYAWPSYASAPNYGALAYPKQYSPSAWPYIGPFYPYPQVPLGWRKVSMEWDDGWWFLDFHDK